MFGKDRPLTERQLAIIAYVGEHESCLVADIASHLKIERYLARDAVNRLAKQGYLTKRKVQGVIEGTAFNENRTHVAQMTEVRLGERRLQE